MKASYRVYKPWCQGALIWANGGLSKPHDPGLAEVVEAVDQIIHRMMKG